jgi:folate-binding protein YgfZ
MSPQVTFKSTEEKAPTAPQALAPRLRDAARAPFVPSHGTAPAELPPAPAGLEDLGPAAALRVVGPEREMWLQGMQTNDLAAAPLGGAVEGAFLGGKGRLVAEALLWRFADEVVVTTAADRLEKLRAHLDKLLIMEDAELQDAPGLHRLRWFPGGTPPAGDPGATLSADAEGFAGPLGFELLVPEARARELLAAIPERPQGVEAYRIALGVPRFGKDLDEETTPIEAGLDRMISFGKGCYVGQEVVAMATYRGRVAWNLVRLEVEGPAPAEGSKLDAAHGAKGRVTSAVQIGGRSILLGYVHKESIVPGSTVGLEDGRTARVLGLPFGSRPGGGVCA